MSLGTVTLNNQPFTIIDMTHTLTSDIPAWDDSNHFTLITKNYSPDCITPRTLNAQILSMDSGIGTHIDMPAHGNDQGLTTETFDLKKLIVPCYIIDVSKKANQTYLISQDDITAFEEHHGCIQEKSLVIFYTGWERFWDKPEQYRNAYQFPTLAEETARFLVNRKVYGVGIDTLSVDLPESGFPVHYILNNAGLYIIENVAHALRLPPIGAYTIALPLKIKGGTESPLRLLGLMPFAPIVPRAITINHLALDDIPTIVDAFASANWYKPASLFEDYFEQQKQGKRIVWIARHNNIIAGYIILKWHSGYPEFAHRNVPEIADFNVLPPFRKKGIGSHLLNIAERTARTRSMYVGLGVGLYADYGAAQQLYIKRGYIPDGKGITYKEKYIEPGGSTIVADDLTLWLIKKMI